MANTIFKQNWSRNEIDKKEVQNTERKENRTVDSEFLRKAAQDMWNDTIGKGEFAQNKKAIDNEICRRSKDVSKSNEKFVKISLNEIKNLIKIGSTNDLVKTVAYLASFNCIVSLNEVNNVLNKEFGTAIPNDVISEINSFYRNVITPDYIKEYLPELEYAPEVIAEKLADITVKVVEATIYIGGKLVLGAAEVVEDAVVYVAGTATLLVGRKDISEKIYKAELVNKASEFLDENFSDSERIKRIGDFSEKLGAVATYFALTVLAGFEEVPIAVAAVILSGLAHAGNTTSDIYQKVGEYNGKIAFYGAATAVITAITTRLASELATVKNDAFESAVAEIKSEIGAEAKSLEFMIAKLLVGAENSFSTGVEMSLIDNIGNFTSDIIGKFLNVKDGFETTVSKVISDAIAYGTISAGLFIFSDVLDDIISLKASAAIEGLKETDILAKEMASRLLNGECTAKDLSEFLHSHKDISLNDIVATMIEQVFSDKELLNKLIESNPLIREQAERVKQAINIINDPMKTALEKKNASIVIDTFKGRLFEVVVKDVLSKIGLSVEMRQRVLVGSEGPTRPDIIAKNVSNQTYKLFGHIIKPGDVLSIECKCGIKRYLEQELKTHIPTQLAGQIGKRVLLTTSDINEGLESLLNSVLKQYNATAFNISMNASNIRNAILEGLGL